ncbi:MAG: hypothetical protein ACREMG_09110, partial [Gemmatimonadales bacterium]
MSHSRRRTTPRSTRRFTRTAMVTLGLLAGLGVGVSPASAVPEGAQVCRPTTTDCCTGASADSSRRSCRYGQYEMSSVAVPLPAPG